MYSFQKYQVVPARNVNRFYVKAHSRKDALLKLVEYVKNERNYSEREIKKFIVESSIEKIDC